MGKISRKEFIKNGLSAAAGAGLVISCASDQSSGSDAPAIHSGKKHRFKMVTTWPPNFPVLGEICSVYADIVEKMSAGRIKIKVYGGGELVPALETFDSVSSGTVEMGSGASYYWAGKSPATLFFASIPFGMNSQLINTWMDVGGGMELWKEVYADFNVVPFKAGNTGVQMGGWFNKKIESASDLRGLKMRIPGLGGNILQKAGGTPLLVAGGELYTNLERGVIDALEWIGPYHDYLMGFHKVAQYYYYPGWHELGTILEFTINKHKFEELSPDLQAILEYASYYANSWVLSEFEHKNAEYLAKIKEEGKVEILPFPKDVIDTMRKYSDRIPLARASQTSGADNEPLKESQPIRIFMV